MTERQEELRRRRREALETIRLAADSGAIDRVINYIRDQDAPINHLFCDHCGDIANVHEVDFIEQVRHLCTTCRMLILEWV